MSATPYQISLMGLSNSDTEESYILSPSLFCWQYRFFTIQSHCKFTTKQSFTILCFASYVNRGMHEVQRFATSGQHIPQMPAGCLVSFQAFCDPRQTATLVLCTLHLDQVDGCGQGQGKEGHRAPISRSRMSLATGQSTWGASRQPGIVLHRF